MATSKVSELTELTSADNADLLLIADTSAGQSKKITKANITEQNFTTALKTKLDGIETAADVTDTANVTAAGALMDSEVTNLAQVKAFSSADYATAAQGTLADSALQSSDIGTSVQAYSSVLAGTTASFTTADETKLDGIETGATADQTAQEIATAIDADATAETTLKSALGLGTAAYTASTDYATAAQGTLADSALQSSDIGSTVQGYDATIVVDADIGSTVQAYDADTAKLDVTQNYTAPQRGTVTTDNDGSFDMNVTNNFKCTPTGNFTLTFTNITAGQSGFILLVNSGGHTVSAHANTKVDANLLATVSAAGTYLLSYFSDGTNIYMTNSAVYT